MTKSARWFRMTRDEQYAERERCIAMCQTMLPDFERINPGAAEQLYLRILRLEVQNERLALVIAHEEVQRRALPGVDT